MSAFMILSVTATADGRFGSSINHPCDNTIYSECVGDDQYVTVAIYTPSNYTAQIRAAMAYYSSSAVPFIVMTEQSPSPPNYRPNVYVWTVSSTINALAWTICWDAATYGGSDSSHTRWCSPADLYYNTRYEASYFPTDAAKRYIACHELGHTFGLQHPKSGESLDTCMRSAVMSPKYVPTQTYISQTEKNQISTYFMYGQVSI